MKFLSTNLKLYSDGSYRAGDGISYHRLDGPAYIHPNGSQEWFVDGKFHRLDDPAYIRLNGYQKWYIHGNAITDQVIDWMKDMNIEPDYVKWTDKEKMWFKLRFV